MAGAEGRLPDAGSRGHHHVYVVLLDPRVMRHRAFVDQNPNLAPDTVCLYVGMTGLSPEDRFASHKDGYKANRYVQRYGVKLMPELYAGLKPRAASQSLNVELSASHPHTSGASSAPMLIPM